MSLCLGWTACAGSDGAAPDAGAVSVDAATSADAGPATYPAGPYGIALGDTLVNLSFAGYLVASPPSLAADVEFASRYDLAAFRQLGFRYALINGSTQWCAPCREEAMTFVAEAGRYATLGGAVLSVLTEDVNLAPASRTTLEQWNAEFGVNYTMMHDPRGEIDRVIAPASYPLNLIVDLESMKILRISTGLDDDLFTQWEATLSN